MRIFRYLLTFSLSFAFVFAAGCSDPKPDYSEFYKPQPGDEPEEPVNPGLDDNQLKVMSFNIRYSSGDDGVNSWDNRKQAVPAMSFRRRLSNTRASLSGSPSTIRSSSV